MTIADLKPYTSMKDSAVPWLGEVPEHWEVRRLKQICRLAYGDALATDVRQQGSVLVYGSNGRVGFHSSANTKAPCIVIGRKGSFGKVNFSPDPVFAIDTTFFVDDRFSAADMRWLFYLLGWLRLDEVSKDSAVPGLDREDAYQRMAAFPSLLEQAAIVRYLDYMDRRIRRYIRAKQKLIKLLEEQKQAIIHIAVTRGLDPNVRLKPSGVEWLGDIPDHWEVQRTKTMFRLRTEKSGVAHDHELLSIYTHIGVRPRRELEEKGNKASTTDDYWIVKRGDIICNKLLTWMGAIGVSNYEGVTSPAYDILMPIRELVPEFYHHAFRTKLYLQQFKQHSRGIMDMRLRLYFDQFGQIPIIVPAVEEQAAIVAYYNDVTANLEKTIETARREIALLREYRTRLIADVVTGKLDVREAAGRLPDEADEPDLVNEGDAMSAVDDGPVADLDTVPEEVEA